MLDGREDLFSHLQDFEHFKRKDNLEACVSCQPVLVLTEKKALWKEGNIFLVFTNTAFKREMKLQSSLQANIVGKTKEVLVRRNSNFSGQTYRCEVSVRCSVTS